MQRLRDSYFTMSVHQSTAGFLFYQLSLKLFTGSLTPEMTGRFSQPQQHCVHGEDHCLSATAKDWGPPSGIQSYWTFTNIRADETMPKAPSLESMDDSRSGIVR